MRSDFSLNKSTVRTKNCSLNMPDDQHNFMGTRTQERSDEKTNAVYQVESVYQVELKSLASCTRLSPSSVALSWFRGRVCYGNTWHY